MRSSETLHHLNLQIFTAFEDAEPLWRSFEETGDAYVYQTYDWLVSWYELVGANSSAKLALVALMDDEDQPLMFLPLAIERRRLRSVLTWLGSPFSDYNAPILAQGAAFRVERLGGIGKILEAFQRKLPKFDYVNFERQPAFIGSQPNPFADLASIQNSHAAHSTRLSGDWPSYYKKKRSKKTRHNDRRKRRKLENHGCLEFSVARTPEDIDVLVSAMLRQKRAYVKALGKKNVLDEPGYDDFLREQALEGLKTGATLLCGLKLDDKILAVQWGAIHKGRLYSIIASYDGGEHSNLSPGEFLLHELFSWCFDHDIDVFDFTYGDEPYKQAWCEENLVLFQSLLPASAWGKAGVCALKTRIMAKRLLKDAAFIRRLLTAQQYLREKASIPNRRL